MSLSNARAFELRVEQSLELRSRLAQIRSPIDLIALAREEDLELTAEDMREIAQGAYGDWVVKLEPPVRSFFDRAQQTEALNRELKQCRSLADALAKPTGGNRLS